MLIADLQEGIFYSKLLCSSDADTVEIDSRTSDALALAVRFGCPIYIYENIFDIAGVENPDQSTLEEKNTVPEPSAYEDLKKMSLDELNTLLNEVLEQEDYIRAIAIRDEINARKK